MIIHESITDIDGTIRLDDLDEGWYTVTELAAPKGYLIANEYKDVYLSSPTLTVQSSEIYSDTSSIKWFEVTTS